MIEILATPQSIISVLEEFIKNYDTENQRGLQDDIHYLANVGDALCFPSIQREIKNLGIEAKLIWIYDDDKSEELKMNITTILIRISGDWNEWNLENEWR